MKKMNKSPLAAAMGAAVITTLSVAAHAESNPFGMTELNGGYMQVAEGEMSCGASMNGMDKSKMAQPKAPEGGCAGQKSAPAAEKSAEAKCGEKKCASMMDGDKMKKGMENACGAMMKGKDGSCGAMPEGQ